MAFSWTTNQRLEKPFRQPPVPRSPQLGQDFTIASQSIIAVRAWMRAGTATESKLTHGPRGFRKLIASGPHRAVGQRRLAACRKLRRKVGNSAAHGSNDHGRVNYPRTRPVRN